MIVRTSPRDPLELVTDTGVRLLLSMQHMPFPFVDLVEVDFHDQPGVVLPEGTIALRLFITPLVKVAQVWVVCWCPPGGTRYYLKQMPTSQFPGLHFYDYLTTQESQAMVFDDPDTARTVQLALEAHAAFPAYGWVCLRTS